MGSFKSHSLKKNILRVVAVVWVQRAWETTKRDRLTVSMFSGVPEVRGRPHLFSDTLPVSPKFSTHNRMYFRSGTRSRGGDLVASTERTLHRYDRVTLREVGFDGKWALLVGPHHLYDCGVL